MGALASFAHAEGYAMSEKEEEARIRLIQLAQSLVEYPVSHVVILTRGRVVPAERHRPGEGGPPPGLSAQEQRVWRKTTARPQSAKQIGAACGIRAKSELYRVLARLVDLGLLLHGRGRYRRP